MGNVIQFMSLKLKHSFPNVWLQYNTGIVNTPHTHKEKTLDVYHINGCD